MPLLLELVTVCITSLSLQQLVCHYSAIVTENIYFVVMFGFMLPFLFLDFFNGKENKGF